MKTINILDCTLRDGGYYNNWDFSSKLVNEYLKTMSKVGIEYVELGFRSFQSSTFRGSNWYTTDNYITKLRRGTLGTAVVQRITPGYLVVDGGKDQTLPATNTHTNTWYDAGSGTAADGLGIQQSSTVNANFLKACEAEVPNYRLELNDRYFVQPGYVEEDYIEVLP